MLGFFALIIISIAIILIIKHRRNQKDMLEDSKYEIEDEDDYNDNSKEDYLDLDEEEDLFRRVNKEKFKFVQKKDDNNIELAKQLDESEKNKAEVVENYFRSLEDKRKGKHF